MRKGDILVIPDHITRDDIERALQEIQREGVPKRRQSTKYSVQFEGDGFPPKYVISIAHKMATGTQLSPSEFSGGRETNRFLEQHGFEIKQTKARTETAKKESETASDESAHSTVDSRSHTGNHCTACKSTIHDLLQQIYGEAIREFSTSLSARLEDYEDTSYYEELRRVYNSLANHRGHSHFVKATSLRPYDYFVPDPGMIIELDESQHFTKPRWISLEEYPDDLSLGFDRRRWISLCKEIHASDSDPAYRDEQRAWYDTLRDFAPLMADTSPEIPVVRLYANDREWCTLDPSAADDVEQFRDLLTWSVDQPGIEIRSDPDPTVARVILTSRWPGDPERARKALKTVCKEWPSGHPVTYLITCGGFLQFELDTVNSSSTSEDGQVDIDPLLNEAEEFAREFLDDGLVQLISEYTRYITLGVDSTKQKISTTANRINKRHIEAVVLADLEEGTYYTTAKSYPTSAQAQSIIRNTIHENHFIKEDDGSQLMLLGCHDLTMYNPRAIANAKGQRKRWSENFRSLAEEKNPEVVLQHPHTADTPNTWRNAWNRLEQEHESVDVYAGAGKYWKEDGARADLDDVLNSTKEGSTLDFILRSNIESATEVVK